MVIEQIKQLMRRKGLSQIQLSEEAKIGYNTVKKILNNKVSPTLYTLERVANALDCEIVLMPRKRHG